MPIQYSWLKDTELRDGHRIETDHINTFSTYKVDPLLCVPLNWKKRKIFRSYISRTHLLRSKETSVHYFVWEFSQSSLINNDNTSVWMDGDVCSHHRLFIENIDFGTFLFRLVEWLADGNGKYIYIYTGVWVSRDYDGFLVYESSFILYTHLYVSEDDNNG